MTHWLQASGIFSKIKYPYMNKNPLIPLPKQSEGEALRPIQMVTVMIVWGSGVIIGFFSFLLELTKGKMKVSAMKNNKRIRRVWS